jgi:hypothetical protein
MKSNGVNTFLNWGLMAGAVLLVIAGFKYYNQSKTARTYRGLIGEVSRFQTANNMVSAIVQETIEYSKTHPEIKPTLDSVLPKQPAPATAKPAAK